MIRFRSFVISTHVYFQLSIDKKASNVLIFNFATSQTKQIPRGLYQNQICCKSCDFCEDVIGQSSLPEFNHWIQLKINPFYLLLHIFKNHSKYSLDKFPWRNAPLTPVNCNRWNCSRFVDCRFFITRPAIESSWLTAYIVLYQNLSSKYKFTLDWMKK